jgi:hypothetical protein
VQIGTPLELAGACVELEGMMSWAAVSPSWQIRRRPWLMALDACNSAGSIGALMRQLATSLVHTALEHTFDMPSWVERVEAVCTGGGGVGRGTKLARSVLCRLVTVRRHFRVLGASPFCAVTSTAAQIAVACALTRVQRVPSQFHLQLLLLSSSSVFLLLMVAALLLDCVAACRASPAASCTARRWIAATSEAWWRYVGTC